MNAYRIAILVGSLRQDSLNRQLAQALIKLAPPEFSFENIAPGDLPHYNQDEETRPTPPVEHLRATVRAAHGVLFVTPEYNRSIPGVLKNALDHGSRPYGQSVWSGKPAGIIGISPGALGTAAAQQHLRNILAFLDMPTLGQPEAFVQAKDGLFTADGGIGPASGQFLQGWMNRYTDWVKKHCP